MFIRHQRDPGDGEESGSINTGDGRDDIPSHGPSRTPRVPRSSEPQPSAISTSSLPTPPPPCRIPPPPDPEGRRMSLNPHRPPPVVGLVLPVVGVEVVTMALVVGVGIVRVGRRWEWQ